MTDEVVPEATSQQPPRTSRRLYDRVTLVLAVVAIVFAVIQFCDARLEEAKMRQIAEKQSSDSISQQQKMKEIAESVSTRYIGEFPKNMENIIQVVSGTTKELDIMVDFLGYGDYASPVASRTYFRKILDLPVQQRAKVKMLVYSRKAQAEVMLPKMKPLIEGELQAGNVQRFFKERYATLPVPKTYEEFTIQLANIETDFENQLSRNGVEVRHISSALPFLLWIEDDEDGVISFQRTEESKAQLKEISFRTRDGILLKTFKDSFQRIWEANREAPSRPIIGP